MRTTIQVDDELAARVRRVAPRRGLNRFVNEAIAAKVAEIERAALDRDMKQGYLATRADRAELNADWSTVDLEAWPDY